MLVPEIFRVLFKSSKLEDSCSSVIKLSFFDYENNELDVDDLIFNFTQKLETCKAHKVDGFNNSYSNLISEHMSILFHNIDGNKSNFDALAVSLQRFTKKFPIIALAETNVCQEMSSMYKLSEYTP